MNIKQNLEYLNLNGCELWPTGGSVLPQFSGLLGLTVSNTNITDSVVQQVLSRYKRLQSIDLSYCSYISEVTALSLKNSLSNYEIKKIYIRGCRIGNAGVELLLTGLPNIEILSLRDCHISNSAFKCITTPMYGSQLVAAKFLQCLDISLCAGIGDIGVNNLSNCPNLRRLNLSGCVKISDASLAVLAEGRKGTLVDLNVSDCVNISASGIMAVTARCFALSRLWLSGCWFIDDDVINNIRKLHPHLQVFKEGYQNSLFMQTFSITKNEENDMKTRNTRKIYREIMEDFDSLKSIGNRIIF